MLLQIQAVNEHGKKGWLSFLKDNPTKVMAYCQELEKATLQILEIPNLLLIEPSTDQSLQALEFIRKYGLLPRDAIHAAVTLDIGIEAIITTDADFAKVPNLKVYTCNPRALNYQG